MSFLDRLSATLAASAPTRPVGRVIEAEAHRVKASGLGRIAATGDVATILTERGAMPGRVDAVDGGGVVVRFDGTNPVRIGDVVRLDGPERIFPSPAMIGRIVDARGHSLDGRPLLPGDTEIVPSALPQRPVTPPIQSDVGTGIPLVDLLHPIRTGMRVLLRAERGLGLLPFISKVADRSDFDLVVWAVGDPQSTERIRRRLGADAMKKAIVVMDQDGARADATAAAIARYFASQGDRVVLFTQDRLGEPSGATLGDKWLGGSTVVHVVCVDVERFGACDPEDAAAFDQVIGLSRAAADAGLMPPIHPVPAEATDATLSQAVARHLHEAIAQGTPSDVLDQFTRADGAWKMSRSELYEWLGAMLSDDVRTSDAAAPEAATGQPNP